MNLSGCACQGWVHTCVYIHCVFMCVCACTCPPRSQRSSVSQSRYIHRIWDTDLKMYRTENAQLEKETAKNEPEMFFLPFPYSQGSYMERKEELQWENNLIPTEWKCCRVGAEELWTAPYNHWVVIACLVHSGLVAHLDWLLLDTLDDFCLRSGFPEADRLGG